MAIAPTGAVIKIAKTATVNTIFPHANPIESGIPPIAACTVAFGVYAIMQNILSFIFSFVFNKQQNTPIIRKINTPKIKTTAAIPAVLTYFRSTVAPTSTNSMISAATHNLLNFPESLLATTVLFFCSAMPIHITAIKDAKGIMAE